MRCHSIFFLCCFFYSSTVVLLVVNLYLYKNIYECFIGSWTETSWQAPCRKSLVIFLIWTVYRLIKTKYQGSYLNHLQTWIKQSTCKYVFVIVYPRVLSPCNNSLNPLTLLAVIWTTILLVVKSLTNYQDCPNLFTCKLYNYFSLLYNMQNLPCSISW